MRFLLDSFFNSSWFLVIVLILAMGLLLFSSFSRKRKEDQYRNELAEKIVKGAKVKTYGGLYATVLSVRNTTDGKIVLIETGEGDKKSYQQLHINAIYGIDDSEELAIDAEGNEVPLSELNKPAETETIEKVEEVKEEVKEEEVKAEPVEEVKEEPAKTTKKKPAKKTNK